MKTKILVMSDSHRDVDSMVEIYNAEKPDAVIHLGDLEDDAAALERRIPGIFVHRVCGNCDMFPQSPERLITRLGGKQIFCAHGHRYNVKFGVEGILNAASAARCDVVLYGHTHVAESQWRDGVLIANPGAVGTYPHKYGVITIEDGEIKYEAKSLS